MSTVERGRKFEKKAINILKKEGYEIIEHTAKKFYCSPYDLKVKKNNQIYCIEVKSRQNGNNFILGKERLKKLKNLNNPCLIFLINEQGYSILDIKKISHHQKLIKLNGALSITKADESVTIAEEKLRKRHPIRLICHRCKHVRDYHGKKKYVTKCTICNATMWIPKCNTSIKLIDDEDEKQN